MNSRSVSVDVTEHAVIVEITDLSCIDNVHDGERFFTNGALYVFPLRHFPRAAAAQLAQLQRCNLREHGLMTPYAPLRILIVEDEALLALELESVLTDAGHEVVGWAASSAEALALATSRQPDLAFVDLQLSDGASGIALVTQMRETADFHAIFLTANPALLPADYGGAMGVIAKPYSLHGILAALGYVHEGLRRPPPSGALPSSLTLATRYVDEWHDRRVRRDDRAF